MQTKTNGIIYKATFPSGKGYSGQTIKTLRRRRNQHERDARGGSETPFHRAIRKYGAENIKWEIIARADNLAELNKLESAAIAEHNTLLPHGYNANTGGGNCIPCDETRAKMAAARARKWAAMSDEEMAAYSVKRSELTKAQWAKKSAAERAEWAAKMHTANFSGNGMRGKKHTAETRAKMTAAQKARYAGLRGVTERAKTAAANKARYAKLRAAA